MDVIQLEQLERWMIRKTQRSRKVTQPVSKNGRKTSLSRWKFCVHADKRQMLQDLIHSLQLRPTKMHVLWELASCICSAVNADGFRLYTTDATDTDGLHLCLSNSFIDENGDPKPLRIKSDAAIPNYVARTREPIRFSKGDEDTRFDRDVLDKVAKKCFIDQCYTTPPLDQKAWQLIPISGVFYISERNGACDVSTYRVSRWVSSSRS